MVHWPSRQTIVNESNGDDSSRQYAQYAPAAVHVSPAAGDDGQLSSQEQNEQRTSGAGPLSVSEIAASPDGWLALHCASTSSSSEETDRASRRAARGERGSSRSTLRE